MYHNKDFGYSGNFRLTKNDIEEILNNVRNGLTIEEAVEDWTCGLDDFEYHLIQEHLKNQIVEYIEEIVEE